MNFVNPEVTYFPKEVVQAAAAQFETPFFLYSEERIRENCRRFRDAFRRFFPGFQPLFAVKANSNPAIVKTIMDEDFELDCSSEAEAWLAHQLAAGGMYTGNYTTQREFDMALKADLTLNLDDVSALEALKNSLARRRDIPPRRMSFRVNPGSGEGSMESLVLAGPDAKFGTPAANVVEAYSQARALGVREFGMHMMTGSNVRKPEYFAGVARHIFRMIELVRRELGIVIEFVNIGGGFGVPYRPEEESLDIDEVARRIHDVFAENRFVQSPEPRLMAEPGRFIAADAGWLVSRVTSVKRGGEKTFVGIDASCNDMPRPSIYDGVYHHVSIVTDETAREVASVVGGICEDNDQFAKDRDLPLCARGDVVVIHNCGAHAYAMGHNYNGRPRHAEYLFANDGRFRQIRRAETVEDLYRLTDIPWVALDQ